MGDTPTPLQGDDFAAGVALNRIAEGSMLLGHAHGEALLLSLAYDYEEASRARVPPPRARAAATP